MLNVDETRRDSGAADETRLESDAVESMQVRLDSDADAVEPM
jgi:hypothetical protein